MDSQITLTDLFYLEDLELARQLVEIGYGNVTRYVPIKSKKLCIHTNWFMRIIPLPKAHFMCGSRGRLKVAFIPRSIHFIVEDPKR